MRLALAVALAAGPSLAEPAWDAHPRQGDLLAFLGGQGCTLSFDSVEAAVTAGFTRDTLQVVTQAAQDAGDARAEGDYIVFDADVCTIRLPEITSEYSVNNPEVQAIAPFTREEDADGERSRVEEGCFLQDPARAFTLFNGGNGPEGFNDFMTFIGAGIISGDVRFFETTPLGTPRGLQIVTGDCAAVENIADIQASHAYIASHFEDYVRFVGANTPCGEPVTPEAGVFAAEVQGYDMDVDFFEQPPVNAWLHFEYLFITMAAGWHEGMSATERGTPRPPLCHYPD